MSEDEYDDELPPISVNNSITAKGNQLVMPSADVLASQRAREEEFEEELRKLRSQYASEATASTTTISPHDSSGSEGEASLAAAIESMKVQPSQSALQFNAADLLQKLITNLSNYDTTFLEEYLDVICKEDEATIKMVTYNIMFSIEHVIKQSVVTCNILNEEELLVVGLWLCVACLWTGPPVANVRRSLHVLITYFTDLQMNLFYTVLSGCMESQALVQVSDIISAPAPAPRALAERLLRAALARLVPASHVGDGRGPLRLDELAAALGGAWRALSPAQRYVGVQVAGRAMAGLSYGPAPRTFDGTVPHEDVSRLLALLAAPPPHACHQPDHLKVLVAVSRLENLFKNYHTLP